MTLSGWRGDGAEAGVKPGSRQPDLLAQRDRLAVARPADVGSLPDIGAAEFVGVDDVADAVVHRRVGVADDWVHDVISAETARLPSNQ